jgi:hypothetical protein
MLSNKMWKSNLLIFFQKLYLIFINLNDSYIKYLKTFMDDDVMIFGCDVNKPSINDKNHRGSSEEMTESVAAVINLIFIF